MQTTNCGPNNLPAFFVAMKPNGFAWKDLHYKRSVILNANVAEVFDSSGSMNTVLRLEIRATRAAGTKTAKMPAKQRAA
jgi:hypothetical protein